MPSLYHCNTPLFTIEELHFVCVFVSYNVAETSCSWGFGKKSLNGGFCFADAGSTA